MLFKALPVGARFTIAPNDSSMADIVFTKVEPVADETETPALGWIPPANATSEKTGPLFISDTVEVEPITH